MLKNKALYSYFRLMRLHQPVGILLLLWPCWWSVALASPGLPSPRILLLFALGAVLMRSAGCIINDIADRDIDRQVERTKTRPLASGELSLTQAATLLGVLLVMALGVAMALGWHVVLWSALALVPVGLYPLMKRISWWPQLFLGLTFNWGALVGWAAVRDAIELPAFLLYAAGICWTLGYDTIYAHQDKVDDARIGVKSTALRLGEGTQRAVGLFYLGTIFFLALAGLVNGASLLYFAILSLVPLHFGGQLCTVNLDDPNSCRQIFISNIRLGGLVFIGLVAGHF